VSNPMNARCGLEDCDCGHTIEKLLKALEELMTSLSPNPHAMDLAKVKDDTPAIGDRTTWGVLRRARAAIEEAKP